MVDMQLLKIDNNVAAVVSSYEDSAVRTASDIAELKKKSTMIEKNRALIKHLRDQAQSYVKNVNSALTRIKTAFIWWCALGNCQQVILRFVVQGSFH